MIVCVCVCVCGNVVFTVKRIHPRTNPHYICIEMCLQLTNCRTKRNNNIPLCARRLKVYYINVYMRMRVCVRRYAAARRVNTSFPVLSGRDRLCSGPEVSVRVPLSPVCIVSLPCAPRARVFCSSSSPSSSVHNIILLNFVLYFARLCV